MTPTFRALIIAASTLALLAVLFADAAAQVATPPSPPPAAPEAATEPAEEKTSESSQFLTYYYVNPEPARLPWLIREFVKETGEDAGGNGPVFSAFYARIMADNPARIEGWLKELHDLPKVHRRSIWRAAAMSNTTEGKSALRTRLDGAAEEDAEFINRMLDTEPPDLLKRNPRSSAALDMLWASFFASGDAAYVRPIINTLALNESEKPGDLVLAGAASWSLQSNAWQHSKVLTLCREEAKTAPESVAKQLREIIEKTEAQLKAEPCPEPKKPR